MAARVIHFGDDDCHRVAVLRRAGYVVAEAADLADLRAHLRSMVDCDAVLIAEDEDRHPAGDLETVRRVSRVPVILFRRTSRELDEGSFSFVVHWLEPPSEWLREVAWVIVRNRTLPEAAD